ncbi:ribosome hibernation-promoting factor, HPF/YfiA family [Rothia aerolata]|uniref:ribosome hibernation-promoting factor, HPF/YfiA family n=1 Tax=Rothia aerolata TaxID=1812262 RepID=UPI0016678272|nr:ribosome-associated translation inhibitor RaiA [Rothia aerolata]
MKTNVIGRNVKVTDRLREYVEEKVVKFEQLERVSDIEVKFTKDGHSGPNTIRVEITVTGQGPVLRAESHGEDKFAVFDDTYGKLLERLRRARDRRKTPKAGGKRPASVSEATGSLPIIDDQVATIEIHSDDVPVEEAAFSTEYSLADEVTSPIEIRRKSFTAERFTPEEAVDNMELVGHDFFIYIDKETGSPSAVYRRKGWSYGVITLTES